MTFAANRTQTFATITHAALLLCAATFVILFLFLLFANYWPGPIFDYWIDIPAVRHFFSGELTFRELVIAHNNSHRILVPRLLFIADYLFSAGSNTLLVLVGIACKLALAALFLHVLRTASSGMRWLATALVCAAVFNASGVYNIVFSSDIQWDLVSLGCCAAIYAYLRATDTPATQRSTWFAIAGLCFLLGLFSHGGALSLGFVFIFLSWRARQWRLAAINLALVIAVFVANAHLPFANPGEAGAKDALLTLLLHPLLVSSFLMKMISAGIAWHSRPVGLALSTITLLAFLAALLPGNHLSNPACRFFLACALFLFLMMVSIAAARCIFTPAVWAASRFQTTAVLFVLCTALTWLAADIDAPVWRLCRAVLLSGTAAIFLLAQYFNLATATKLANEVLSSHAYILLYGANQDNGSRLLLWRHDTDVIADSDPFFRARSAAYYHNKQGGDGFYRNSKTADENLFESGDPSEFARHCPKPVAATFFTGEGGQELSAVLPDTSWHTWAAIVPRNSYYVLDEQGVVSGFAHVNLDDTGLPLHPQLHAYLKRPAARFIAELDGAHHPHCLFQLATPP